MKIAIASNDKNIDKALLCKTAGRAPYYFIFEEGVLLKTLKNPFAVGGGGAGPAVAKMLANESVEKVFCQKFGDKMLATLDSRGISAEEHEVVSVKELVE